MKSMKLAKKLVLFSAVLACLLSLFSCKTTDSAAKAEQSSQAASKDSESKAAKYQELADAATKQCPVEIADGIVFADLSYREKENALAYTYFLTGAMYESMDKDAWSTVQTATKDMMIKGLQEKEDEEVVQFRKDGLKLIYIYKANNDTELFTVVLEPGEY